MEKLHRYSSDLIEFLDAAIQSPNLPMTENGWSNLSDSELRRFAFKAGQRALVDELITMLEEDEDGDRRSAGDNSSRSGGGLGLLGDAAGEGSQED